MKAITYIRAKLNQKLDILKNYERFASDSQKLIDHQALQMKDILDSQNFAPEKQEKEIQKTESWIDTIHKAVTRMSTKIQTILQDTNQ